MRGLTASGPTGAIRAKAPIPTWTQPTRRPHTVTAGGRNHYDAKKSDDATRLVDRREAPYLLRSSNSTNCQRGKEPGSDAHECRNGAGEV